MGFLDKIFGPSKKEKKEVKLSLNELSSYLEEKTGKEREELEKRIFSKFSEVKHLLSGIKSEMGEFRKRDLEKEEGNKRLRKIVATSKKNLLNQMDSLVKKLEPPKKREFAVLKSYCLSSSELLQREINTFGKNISYTGILMKREIKMLGQYINELNTAFLELKKMFESNRLAKIDDIRGDISLLNSFLDENKELSNSIPAFDNEIKRLLEEKKQAETARSKLENSQMAKELKNITEERERLLEERGSLKADFVDLLGTIDKPMKRFVKLVQSRAYLIEQGEETLLNNYLQNPFEAVKIDPKAEKLKKLLSEIKKAILEGKISLKEKEREKKIDALDRLSNYDFFGNIFWKLNKIDSEISALDRQIASGKISKGIEQAEKNIESLERKILELSNSLQIVKNNSKKKEGEIAALKEKIENLLLEAIDEKIVIELG